VESCLYEGRVKHARTQPVVHKFSYRIFYTYLDLAELPELFERRWFWSSERWALARFRRSDHFGDPDEALDVSVRELVESKTGVRPKGPVRLLTHLAYFGYCFNPVSFYYCFDEAGETVEVIVAEVTNTPWGERTCYVLPRGESVAESAGRNSLLRFTPTKTMHVSPFIDMDIGYDWSFTPPGEALKVYMANDKDGERFFDASIALERTEMTAQSLARVLTVYPWMTLRVVAGIYWQALILWAKRIPFVAHPNKRDAAAAKQ